MRGLGDPIEPFLLQLFLHIRQEYYKSLEVIVHTNLNYAGFSIKFFKNLLVFQIYK